MDMLNIRTTLIAYYRTRHQDHPRKTWWNSVKEDMKSLSLSQEDAQSRNKWRRGQLANTA